MSTEALEKEGRAALPARRRRRGAAEKRGRPGAARRRSAGVGKPGGPREEPILYAGAAYANRAYEQSLIGDP